MHASSSKLGWRLDALMMRVGTRKNRHPAINCFFPAAPLLRSPPTRPYTPPPARRSCSRSRFPLSPVLPYCVVLCPLAATTRTAIENTPLHHKRGWALRVCVQRAGGRRAQESGSPSQGPCLCEKRAQLAFHHSAHHAVLLYVRGRVVECVVE